MVLSISACHKAWPHSSMCGSSHGSLAPPSQPCIWEALLQAPHPQQFILPPNYDFSFKVAATGHRHP